MNKRMSPAHYHLCRAILFLDKLPVPMRFKQLRPYRDGWQWTWRPGVFGTTMLVNRGWLFRFADEYAYRLKLKRSNGKGTDR